MPDKTRIQVERDDLGRILKGQQSLNPEGRPKGSISIKDRIRKILEEEPERFEELCKYYLTDKKMRDLLWKQLDGMPRQSQELTGEIKLNLNFNESGYNPKLQPAQLPARDAIGEQEI